MVSPDGKWILYANYYYAEYVDVFGIYIASLENQWFAYSERVSWVTFDYLWSPDSSHFLIELQGWFLGTTDGELTPLAIQGQILGWMDAQHFLSYDDDNQVFMVGSIDGTFITIPAVSPISASMHKEVFAFFYPQTEP